MPVSPEILLAFSIASMALLIVPGPTIILVVSQALAHGRMVALASVLGVALGDLAAATLSLIGVGTILAASATVFSVIKWLGAAWLIYLGVKMWRTPVSLPEIEVDPTAAGTNRATLFKDAFLVTLLNPKGIVFFIAFVPQFISTEAAFAPQATVFVLVFVILGALNAYAYAMLAATARKVVRRPKVLRAATRVGASLLIAAGIGSVFVRRASQA